MAHDVSSWYQNRVNDIVSEPKLKFWVASTDYSTYVKKWPKIISKSSKVRPGAMTVPLANADGTFNFFVSSKMSQTSFCEVEIGFGPITGAASHAAEYESFYQGFVDNVLFSRETVSLKIQDRMRQLTERVIGSQDSSAVFSSTTLLASDIFYDICTSYGGLDSVQSTSNVDIDWVAFEAWASVFSTDTLIMGAEFKGVKCIEGLSKLARMTQSTITTDGIKIVPRRYTVSSPSLLTLDDTLINATGFRMSVSDRSIKNKVYVSGLYIPASNDFDVRVLDENSSSVNSYGLKEFEEKDSAVWYVNSSGCTNLAQRITKLNNDPKEIFKLKTPLSAMLLHVGDIVTITNSESAIENVTGRVQERNIDMNNFVVNLTVGTTELFAGFILDTSTLDGSDLLT